MTRRRVAIIGAGFSGAALAVQLAAQGRTAPEVMLIERRRRFGPGLAYATTDPAHLLNVRAANLSAFPDQPDHFVRWLRRHGGGEDATARFAQRAQYGAYLEDVLRASRRWLGPKLVRLRASVVACTPDGEGWALETDRSARIRADAVVLALGNPPPSPPVYFASSDLPLLDPEDRAALRRLPRGDVLLLGTGLTSVDMALSVARMRPRGVIYALSRRGQLPRPHLTTSAPPAPRRLELPLSLSEALKTLRQDTETASGRGEPWQHVIDRLRAVTPELWQRLPEEAQRRFLRHLRPWWDAHRHRMAPEVAAKIAELQQKGRLRILAGEIVSAEQQGRTIHLYHRQRGSMARHHIEVTGVVNCTGASLDLAASLDPLPRQLFADEIMRAHRSGVGIDVDSEGRVIAPSGVAQANLYALGPITQGVFWESTAVPEIRVRAAALAALLARQS